MISHYGKIRLLTAVGAVLLSLSLTGCSGRDESITKEADFSGLTSTASAAAEDEKNSSALIPDKTTAAPTRESGTKEQSQEKETGNTESGTKEHSQEKETESGSRKSEESKYYSQEDIDEAKDAVREWMNDSFEEGFKLKELYYPGDDFTEEFADSGYGAFKDTDTSMLLGGYWIQEDGIERGTSGYPLWIWILWRGSDGGWYVKDAGY